MELRRRFIFRGNAAAIGGRIVRPTDLVIDSSTASSLTVAGGRSRARAGATRFGEWVSFGGAATSAEGVFDDVKQQIELTFGRVAEDALTMSTRVSADVASVSVGDQPRLTVKHLRASLSGKSPTASGEPAIAVDSDTAIEGAAIDGVGLVITLATPVFQSLNTLSKVLTAADDPKFVRKSGSQLLMKPAGREKAAAPTTRLLQSYDGTTYATIVKSIRWAAEPYRGATIDQHVVTVPGLGKIFFGELLMTDMSRRLTMVRLEIGVVEAARGKTARGKAARGKSARGISIGGVVACAEVETNGAWSN
jgi:hypothetical protein